MRVELEFLGQSGICLRHREWAVYVDPYLSDSVRQASSEPELWARRFPPPLTADQITDANGVLITHEHGDHFDPETIGPLAKASPQARFVIPRALVQRTAALVGEERSVMGLLGRNDRCELGPFGIEAVPAAHSRSYETEEAEDGSHRWLGYVIEVAGMRIYHAGDTVRFDGQRDAVTARGSIDVVLLPVNGRDAYREQHDIVGNLWPREAAELAAELGAPVLIPLHHDLFALNGIPPGQLADYVAERRMTVEVRLLVAGGKTVLLRTSAGGRSGGNA
jgi:L-ascorbate 6-phosphate lactonase